jgi:hypothetical protein
MEAKVENTNEKLIKEIRTKLATLSTNTLLRYYEDIKSKIIPTNLSYYIQYLSYEELLNNIERELILRGALKRVKKLDVR